jgi:general secretion pathway protein F
MRFLLKGIAPDGRIERLDMQAMDEAGARDQALSLGYSVLSIQRGAGASSGWRRAVEKFPLPLFSQELLVLLNAGLPVVSAIETLAQKERNLHARAILERLLALLRQGQPLSAALEQIPAAFSPLYVATVRASERTSDLTPALARYIAYQTQANAIRKRLLNASIYPALLVLAGGGVSLFLLLYVVPRFGRIYEERGGDLPVMSRLLLHWGQAADGHAMLICALAVILAMTVWRTLQWPRVKAGIAGLLWRLPIAGEHLKVYQLARFFRTTGMLLRGGMPLAAALDMGATLLHPVMRERLARASQSIREGRSVAGSMAENDLTTTVALRLLSVGEHGGDMGEMMDRIAQFHDEEISRWVDGFTRLIEPLLMAFIGIVIGGIVILMYLPIFELAGNLQ